MKSIDSIDGGSAEVDSSQRDGISHMLMDSGPGKTLDEIMRERGRPFPAERVVAWALQLAGIMEYLHDVRPEPIIYGNLRPSNIIVTGGFCLRLLDFRSANFHSVDNEGDMQQPGDQGFAPPEQYGFAETDERSDIFSLGAVLYFLLTNAKMAELNFNYPPVRAITSDVPLWFERIVMRCLSREPGDRYKAARSIRKDIASGIAQGFKEKNPQSRRVILLSLISSLSRK